MTRDQDDPVVRELRKISNLLGAVAAADRPKTGGVVLLASAGFSSAEIARLLSTSDASVRAMLSQARKPRRSAKSATTAD